MHVKFIAGVSNNLFMVDRLTGCLSGDAAGFLLIGQIRHNYAAPDIEVWLWLTWHSNILITAAAICRQHIVLHMVYRMSKLV